MNNKESIELYIQSIAELTDSPKYDYYIKFGYSINWIEGIAKHKHKYIKYAGSMVTFTDGLHDFKMDLEVILDLSVIFCGRESIRNYLEEQFLIKISEGLE